MLWRIVADRALRPHDNSKFVGIFVGIWKGRSRRVKHSCGLPSDL